MKKPDLQSIEDTRDSVSEQFYLCRLFHSQYNPDTDGDLKEYLVKRLEQYHNSLGINADSLD